MRKKRKTVRMVVEVSCPGWLTAAQARREVRTLINEQCFFGHHKCDDGWHVADVIGDNNFRARKVESLAKAVGDV